VLECLPATRARADRRSRLAGVGQPLTLQKLARVFYRVTRASAQRQQRIKAGHQLLSPICQAILKFGGHRWWTEETGHCRRVNCRRCCIRIFWENKRVLRAKDRRSRRIFPPNRLERITSFQAASEFDSMLDAARGRGWCGSLSFIGGAYVLLVRSCHFVTRLIFSSRNRGR